MRKIKTMLAVFIAVVLVGGLGMSSVKAVSASITTSTNNHAITLSRTISGVTNAVNNTFTYSVTADQNNPAGASNVPSSGSVVFSNVAPISGTATATGTIELAGSSFTTNGDYTYTVQETGSTDDTVYPVDTTDKYTIKISVRNASATDFSSKVATVTLYSGIGSSATKINNATFPFTSGAETRAITINKSIEGNMADVDQYFTVAVTIDGAAGNSYAIAGQSESGAPSACTVANAATSCTANVRIKHGETVTISGIPVGTNYQFTETNIPNGYSAAVNGGSGASSGQKTVSATASENNNSIVNTYNSPVPTGIILKVLPYVIVIALAVAVIIFVVVKNKKNSDVEVK